MAVKVLTLFFFGLLACNNLSEAKFYDKLHTRHWLVSNTPNEATAQRRALEMAEVPRPAATHYGCFLGQNLQLLDNTILDGNTNAVCQKYCYDLKHMFSATHDDICGCLREHPQKELSGPEHEGATVPSMDSIHECTNPCPGHATDKCEKQFCCGGPGAYTVYQTGGMKSHSLAVVKVLKDYNVDVQTSHLTPVLEDISKRTEVPVAKLKEEVKKPADSEDYKALLDEFMNAKKEGGLGDNAHKSKYSDGPDIQETGKRRSAGSACCSPDCDWLMDYLEIDGTVVKCLD